MKAIVTIIFILFIGLTAQAQDTTSEAKVETIEMGIVKTAEVNEEDNTVARLYRRSNTRVKKALSFTTKRNKAKLA